MAGEFPAIFLLLFCLNFLLRCNILADKASK